MINTFSYLVFHLFRIRDAACCERILQSTVVTLRAVCLMNTAVCSLSFQRQTWAKWRNSDKTRRIPTAHLAWPSDLSLTHTLTQTHTHQRAHTHTNARTHTFSACSHFHSQTTVYCLSSALDEKEGDEAMFLSKLLFSNVLTGAISLLSSASNCKLL